jgi:chromosome segregation protein
MQLKSLEMIGFKSFADKTSVTFGPGVTAVVGPNGCGKSNISDAIRWVLGEQSAKHLRGDKMEDVIFNGTENRKPLGMSEVNLTLTNVAGLSSEFGQYREIGITRRLYRSGESEYLINKIPCRLKDIRDLMMDAGVGAKVHAIIEQARVDQILSAKPQDRRFLFEEVAGVMKYKARRQEALSKLESTQQNQLRVNDIITEVKRQVNSLDRQARKAERYQKLKAEMKDLEFRLASVEYSALGTEWTSSSEQFRTMEDDITRLHSELSMIESSIEETRTDILSRERDAANLQNQLHRTENALREAEHQVEISRSQIASLTEQRGRDIRDREYIEQELARNEEQKKSARDEASVLSVLVQEKNTLLLAKTVESENVAVKLQQKEQALEEARLGAVTAVTGAAEERAKISNVRSRLTHLEEQGELARKELETVLSRLEELRALAAHKDSEIAGITATRNSFLEERTRLTALLDQATARKKSLMSALESAKDRLAAQRSRLQSLLELEQSLEGYQKGVQTVMTARKQGANGQLGTIHGLVADIIETDANYEVAIEAVLGERLQNVVVGSA